MRNFVLKVYTQKNYIKNKWRVLNGILKKKRVGLDICKKNWWIGLSSFYKSTNHSDTIWFLKKNRGGCCYSFKFIQQSEPLPLQGRKHDFFLNAHTKSTAYLYFFTTLPERLTICLSSICLVELTAHAIPFLMPLIIFVM